MSKGIKKKHVSKLMPGQVCIVVDYALAMHIAETYDYLANDANEEYSQSFRDIADDIRVQSAETYYDVEGDEYEEW
jgi:hypothetical protein